MYFRYIRLCKVTHSLRTSWLLQSWRSGALFVRKDCITDCFVYFATTSHNECIHDLRCTRASSSIFIFRFSQRIGKPHLAIPTIKGISYDICVLWVGNQGLKIRRACIFLFRKFVAKTCWTRGRGASWVCDEQRWDTYIRFFVPAWVTRLDFNG